MEIRYVLIGSTGPASAGIGRSIDMSSSGLRFTADRPFAIGQLLDLAIDWPAQLAGGVRLQLSLAGEVVRTIGSTTAIKIQRYEFKTRRFISPQV